MNQQPSSVNPLLPPRLAIAIELNPYGIEATFEHLTNMVWWYHMDVLAVEGYAILAHGKNGTFEHQQKSNQADIQRIKDLQIIQRLCQHANNLIVQELKGISSEMPQPKSKRTAEIPIVHE